MSRLPMRPPPAPSLALLCALAAGLCACSGDINPVRDVVVKTGLGAERKEAPDFVRQSRSKEIDYTPVGVEAPKPKTTAKAAPTVKAVEGQMDAIRAANEARAKAAREAGATVQPVQRPTVPPPAR
jgi:hypothetical protein